ncbi:TPA_asm: coat protein [ssRNA phage Gerhypos.2_27]|uniref:Coat protein n=2 Tax=Leviviricetes TaxID=2842243 RepID=A0A8S5KZG3_9VIRU|nr:coat protein [ssRNA phage Gerhypos.2_27]QDH89444.1 MAG: hypothetical protein H2Bulk35388_000002 [Leviviridae sp.]DAD50242.1 TPA_asm: coat protein [ssRNA phage Gerhypos.2_27]
MSIPNPLVITVNSVAKNLPRINMDNYGSEYYFADTTESWRVKIRHSQESPGKDGVALDRHNVELTHVVYATGSAAAITTQVYTVLRDNPQFSTAVQLGYLQAALDTLVDATFAGYLFGWQS